MSNESDHFQHTLSDRQFQDWQKLVEDKTGMLLPFHRKPFLQSSLNARMQEASCDDYDAYFKILSSNMSGTVEWAILVDRLTVGETDFFRHADSFSLLKNYLRGLMIKHAKNNKPLNVWSVGCSTGEEPYSLATLIEELISELQIKLYYGITATDISLPALSTARIGEYSEAQLSNLSTSQKALMFDKSVGNSYQVKQKYKDKICFARVNLLDLSHVPISDIDVVFCQNVLMYFQKSTRYKILDSLTNIMEPGGLLVLGLGDVTDWSSPMMRKVKAPHALAFTRNISQ